MRISCFMYLLANAISHITKRNGDEVELRVSCTCSTNGAEQGCKRWPCVDVAIKTRQHHIVIRLCRALPRAWQTCVRTTCYGH